MSPITNKVAVNAVHELPLKGQPQNTPVSGAILALPLSGSAGKNLTEQQRVEAKVRTWVAQTFFGTLMKQLRDSPFKDEKFSGGKGGDAYGSLYDQQIVQRMAVGAGSKLVSQITKKILNGNVTDARKAYVTTAPRPVDSLQRPSSPLAAPTTTAAPNSKAFKELPRVPAGLRA